MFAGNHIHNVGKRIDFDDLEAEIEPFLLDVLQEIFDDGQLQGNEFVMINPRRQDSSPGSFKFNIQHGLWADFACDKRGKGMISLVAYAHNVSLRRAAHALAEVVQRLKKTSEKPTTQRVRTAPIDFAGVQAPVSEPVLPVPETAEPMMHALGGVLARIGKVARFWEYFNAEGKVMCYVIRLQMEGGKKTIRHATYRRFSDGTCRWAIAGLGMNRPLYNLPSLVKRASSDVIFVEGEKSADAAQRLCPDMVAVTTMNGALSPHKTDLLPLKGRNVYIWADNDDPGFQYAAKVEKLLREIGVNKIVNLGQFSVSPGRNEQGAPTLIAGFSPSAGWDAADAEAAGWTPGHMLLVLEKASTEPQVNQIVPVGEAGLATLGTAMPEIVAGVVQQFFPNGLVFCQQTFYSYRNGYWAPQDDQADIQRSVAMYLGADATTKRLNNVVGLLRAFFAVGHVFAPNRKKICLQNGTFDTDTFELGSHSPEYALLNQLNFSWDKDAECPLWMAFLDQTFRGDADKAEKIEFLKQWFGYCLTTDVTQQKFLWLVGSGANGKSVILTVLRELIGTPNVHAASLSELKTSHVRAELENKLLNISSEMSANDTVSDGYLKQIVAGDPIEAARKFKNSYTFRPFVKLVASTNNLPRLLDLSHGFARRAIILTFNNIVAQPDMDPQLESKLLTELPGIAAWAVSGLRNLRHAGNFVAIPSSSAMIAQYRMESDPVALFADEELEKIIEGVGIRPTELFQSYRDWARRNGFSDMNIQTFGKRLVALGFVKRRRHAGDEYLVSFKSSAFAPAVSAQPSPGQVANSSNSSPSFRF